MKLFFDASHSTEDLMAELEQAQVNIESVNRILEIATNDMNMLEERNIQYCSKCSVRAVRDALSRFCDFRGEEGIEWSARLG